MTDRNNHEGERPMAKTTNGITDAQIRALSTEAAEHGDLAQVAVCERALDGDGAARAECARVIDLANDHASGGDCTECGEGVTRRFEGLCRDCLKSMGVSISDEDRHRMGYLS